MLYYLLLVITFAVGAYAAHSALIAAPADAMQGNVQRIFYFHVPLVWVSFVAFIGGALMSIRYLKSRRMADDAWARAFIKTGWAFTTTVLVTGPLWAKPVWGTYWNWGDERLISFFVMWMMYNGYILLRATIQDFEKGARIGAVLALLALANAVLVVAAIYIWKTASHPGPVFVQKAGGGVLDPMMRRAFWLNFSAFSLLFVCILVAKFRFETAWTVYNEHDE
ncbi:cytochrome c biogenesis protein CcsA [Turneriella parva]|uniref:Heme exporter protein C n=1 Tax=Turneriella parva (strain ATCC BAA-1111 / DSM 21527 / NCTC 11395 / H) TaxID=869212 RepID=I4B6B0_TURPD|nr:cytochrome c biogenesis protein CcsA [Turneriella parva]AFM12817.1 cytochrome c assembly protein [Turneriella parva DSM 21527]